MSPQQVVAVGARLLAVWLVIRLPGHLYQFYALVSDGINASTTSLLAFSGCTLVVEVLLVLGLWFFPLTIAHKLLRTSSAEPPAPSPPDMWLSIGCALIGLVLLTTSVPGVLLNLYILVGSPAEYAGDNSLRHDVTHNVLYNCAQIAIGLWLILGARGFREVFWWAQRAGVRKSSP